ncbi:hypothetical protein [Pseudomonas vanderleydeniana]|uniref:Uncharacterized protein n=1 Tax=Pseudomonas vanderleydeniana TaxID=2745495 RepID=A0A9E6TQ92_9PSED|nr:hypothetical protein [Pseudomonas vanderleydeniana]QXI27253.1 hypothetical protein HU752_025565 [Pseudomonas vanderleydeniana]
MSTPATRPFPLNADHLARQLAGADLAQAFNVVLDIAAQPLSRQAVLLLGAGVLPGIARQLRHVLPSATMRPRGAVPLAYALHALREAMLLEPDPRRRVLLAHECIDCLLAGRRTSRIGLRIAILHGLESMDLVVQGFIALVEVCASILRDRAFIMARLGITAGWFGGDTGVAAKLGRPACYGSGGHISRARFAIMRNLLRRGDDIRRPAPGMEPVLDASWLRREYQLELYRSLPCTTQATTETATP